VTDSPGADIVVEIRACTVARNTSMTSTVCAKDIRHIRHERDVPCADVAVGMLRCCRIGAPRVASDEQRRLVGK